MNNIFSLAKIDNNNNKGKEKKKNVYKFYGSYGSKLKGLNSKNLLILKWNKISTLFEILFPIILMLLMYGFHNSFFILEYEYITGGKNTKNLINSRSLENVDINYTDIVYDSSNN